MFRQSFSAGHIRLATYDPRSQQLELTWDNKNISAYKPVPLEIYRRLCSAPNPATYVQDRIAEEYTPVQPATSSDTQAARKNLSDLFGD
jgi:hypothetical protein